MKNKGFTLIELVVAMGVGSIVLLMVSVMLVRGTSLFHEENDEVNVRNDYQIIRNQLDQALMEAKVLIIEEQGNDEDKDIIIYTGELDKSTREFSAVSKTTEKIITYDIDKKTLYISSSYAEHKSEGNMISDTVEKFDIKLDPTCAKKETVAGVEVTYYVNPLRVNITLELLHKKSDISSKYTVNLRNKIKETVKYITAGETELLNSATNVQVFKVK